jgi:hypothetical protein
MYRSVFIWEFAGILVIFLLGSIIHEAYKLTGQSVLAAMFAPVNESVWEHLKMGSSAVLAFSFIEYFFIAGSVHNFLLAKTLCLYIVPLLIALLHYSYKIVVGRHLLVLDLFVFLISISAGQLVSFYLLSSPRHFTTLNRLALLALILAVGIFVYCTFKPPMLTIFKDATTGKHAP